MRFSLRQSCVGAPDLQISVLRRRRESSNTPIPNTSCHLPTKSSNGSSKPAFLKAELNELRQQVLFERIITEILFLGDLKIFLSFSLKGRVVF